MMIRQRILCGVSHRVHHSTADNSTGNLHVSAESRIFNSYPCVANRRVFWNPCDRIKEDALVVQTLIRLLKGARE